MGDLLIIYFITKRDNIDYNLEFIPESFDIKPKEDFNTEYMRKLYNLGYELASEDYPWEKYPPGYLGTEKEKIFIAD